MHPLESYLLTVRAIRHSGEGVEETSYYPALATLLNEVGSATKPRVLCIMNPKDRGAGIPDGGFFTPDQLRASGERRPDEGQLPSRGVLEVKGVHDVAGATAEGEQVTRYLEHYGQVLVTNLRDFILMGRDSDGKIAQLESYRLAPSEGAFLDALHNPRRVANEHGEDFFGFLRRVLTRPAPLVNPADVAWTLAAYARDARSRAADVELPALASLRQALEDALGMRFDGQRGENFFRSTLVQTLFYGVFSAWVLWCRQGGAGRFEWRTAGWTLRVPAIRALFHQITDPERLSRLGLVEPLDWAGEALNRVDRTAFFARFQEEHAVQYFYEPFLESFDPALRKELGVWYTPPEVVKYMVARVDTALRDELGIADGLADRRVRVLDPCCGTGAYLVEVLETIARRLRENGDDALLAAELRRAAAERVFGFEILPAPFVVAHLQLGLTLQQHGAASSADPDARRVGVFLTNALVGWGPPADEQKSLAFPELQAEHDAADAVKHGDDILVVLGNPPYNGYPGAAIDEERGLVEAYRSTKRAPKPQGQGLNDLYVRFFRMAERRIVEMTGRGVVCFISNYSWLDGLSFTGMRERYLDAFDGIWIDSLNGDKYRTGKLTPAGDSDPSIFSTDWNREGIQVGTAVSLLVRKELHEETDSIHFRNLWGKGKRNELLESAVGGAGDYEVVEPAVELGLPFAPRVTFRGYMNWPAVDELFPVSLPGILTARDDTLVDIDQQRLAARLSHYFDQSLSDDDINRRWPSLMRDTRRFDAATVRKQLLRRGFLPDRIVRYAYRPFDLRWLYWEPETKLLDEKRAELVQHVFPGNVWLTSTRISRKGSFYQPYVTSRPLDYNLNEAAAKLFPLLLAPPTHPETLFDTPTDAAPRPNLSDRAAAYLAELGAEPETLFHHVVAILHAPDYRAENAGALRQDWPRVPLPADRVHLEASAALGRKLAALLDPERSVAGVSAGAIREELRPIAAPARVDGGQLDEADFAVTAGWGHAGKGGATMPGRGRAIERDYTADERGAIEAGAAARELSADQVFALLGERCYDVWLNDTACWRCVPERVWEYTLGGYQVIKKWLSYREEPLLGRALKLDEVREVSATARRIAAILLLEPALDEVYAAVKGAVEDW